MNLLQHGLTLPTTPTTTPTIHIKTLPPSSMKLFYKGILLNLKSFFMGLIYILEDEEVNIRFLALNKLFLFFPCDYMGGEFIHE